MMSSGGKTILTFFIIFGIVFHQCRSDEQDNDPDEQESDETFETHLWSRLSKDHSSRDKRESDDFSDSVSDSKWTKSSLRKGRNLLSVENDSRPPPSFEKVRICFKLLDLLHLSNDLMVICYNVFILNKLTIF